MSTSIELIQGVKESDFDHQQTVETTMHLNRFYGGAENGSMLQLTVNNSDGYIQLTEEQSIELAKILLNSFDCQIYPSE